LETVNILLVGPSGSGKSTLIRAITGRRDIETSHWAPCTMEKTFYMIFSKIKFMDTKGFENWQPSELKKWRSQVYNTNLNERPHAILFLHNAAHRFYEQHVQQIFNDAISQQIPIIFILTNIYGVDKRTCNEVRIHCAIFLSTFSDNPLVRNMEVNSEDYHIQNPFNESEDIIFKPKGVTELVAHLSQQLAPAMALSVLYSVRKDRSFLSDIVGVLGEAGIHIISVVLPLDLREKFKRKLMRNDLAIKIYDSIKVTPWKQLDKLAAFLHREVWNEEKFLQLIQEFIDDDTV